MKNPKFTIAKDKSGKFCFNLKAGNGQIILQSQAYKSKSGCQNGIESVRKNSTLVSAYEKKVAKNGQHYFVLKAANSEPLGRSEMYKSTSGMNNGIRAIGKVAGAAPVEDLT